MVIYCAKFDSFKFIQRTRLFSTIKLQYIYWEGIGRMLLRIEYYGWLFSTYHKFVAVVYYWIVRNPIILNSKIYYSSIVAVLKIRTFLKEKSGKVVHKWETLTLFQWNCPAEGHKLIVTMKKLITFLSVVFVRKEKIWWFFHLIIPKGKWF